MRPRLVSLVLGLLLVALAFDPGDRADTGLGPGRARSRRWSSPPPGSTRATASGWSPVPTTSSTTRSWRRCSRSIPRPASTRPAWPRSGSPAPTSRSGPSPAQGRPVPLRLRPVHRQGRRPLALLMMRPEATATLAGFWRRSRRSKVVNDHQVVFRFKRPTTVMPYAASRAGDLRIVSKAQWDKEGHRGVRQAAGRHRLLPLRRPAAGPVRHASSASTTTGTARSRRSRSWSSGWPARSRRGWRCCCPARPTSPTCRASCRRTRSSGA